jgi:hypothetical protein
MCKNYLPASAPLILNNMNYNMFILPELMQLTLDKSEKAHGEFTGVQGTKKRN